MMTGWAVWVVLFCLSLPMFAEGNDHWNNRSPASLQILAVHLLPGQAHAPVGKADVQICTGLAHRTNQYPLTRRRPFFVNGCSYGIFREELVWNR